MTGPEGESEADRTAREAHRAEILVAMSELAESSRDLKILFDRLDLALRRAAPAIEAGTGVVELVDTMNLPGRREALGEAAARARTAQRALLSALFRAAEAEGASQTDIARTWRVSRQLVSRMIRGPR